MRIEPLMEYFKPLEDWLKSQTQGEKLGWEDECYMVSIFLSKYSISKK